MLLSWKDHVGAVEKTYSGYDFASLDIIFLPKPWIRDIQNTFSIAMVYNTALLLKKEVTSQSNKHGIGFRFMMPSFHHPEATDLKWWDELLKTQLQSLLGRILLKGSGKFLPIRTWILNQHPVYGTISSILNIPMFRYQGLEMGMLSVTII